MKLFKNDYSVMGRSLNVDVVKGIAIFFVVWGHVAGLFGCTLDDFLSKFLTSFNMPLFAFMGGYMFKPSRCKKEVLFNYLVKKTRRLLIPALFWVVLTGIPLSIYSKKIEIIDLWYIYGIYIVYVVMGILFAYFERCTIIAVILATIILWLIPYDLWYSGFLLPFFYIGFLASKNKNRIALFMEKYKVYIVLISIITYGVMLCFFNQSYYIYFGGISLTLSDNWIYQIYINMYRIIQVLPVLALLYYIIRAINKTSFCKSNIYSRYLPVIGLESLAIYIVHVVLLFPLRKFVPLFFHWIGIEFSGTMRIIGECFIAPLFAAFVIIICLIIKKLVEKIPYVNKIAF